MRAILVSFLLTLQASPTLATTCIPERWSPKPEHVAARYNNTASVFVAKVVSSDQFTDKTDPDVLLEQVTFEVVESLKGTFHVGSVVTIVQTLEPHGHGHSVINSPQWVQQFMPDGSAKTAKLPNHWLVYALGKSEGWLATCTGSSPMFQPAAEELELLRRIASKAKQ